MHTQQAYSRRGDAPEAHVECTRHYAQLEEKYVALKDKYAELKCIFLFFLSICADLNRNTPVQRILCSTRFTRPLPGQ
jgi:hypothetical protein